MKCWLVMVLAVFAASCAAHGNSPVNPPVNPPVTASGPDLSYVLQLRRAQSPIVSVEVTVQGLASPITLGCNNWGGVEHCEKQIADLRVYDANEQLLTARQAANEWSIDAPPGSPIRVTYTLAPLECEGMASEGPRDHYPVVTDQDMHFVGDVALLAPREPKGLESRIRTIALHWRGFAEAGWKVASAFGLGNDLSVRRSFGDFVHSVFVAGDYQILRAASGAGEVILAIRSGAWKFGSLDVLATALPVINEVRSIFGASSPSPLLITATPMIGDTDGASGTMLTDSIALFLPRPSRLLPAPILGAVDRTRVLPSLGHQHDATR